MRGEGGEGGKKGVRVGSKGVWVRRKRVRVERGDWREVIRDRV